MTRGGKRPGSGRKRGGKNQKSREIADKAAAAGITPLEVMLDAMRRHHKAKRYDEAAAIAQHAAPYIHPRLSTVTHGGTMGVQLEIVEEIVEPGTSNAAENNSPPSDPGSIPPQ